MFSIGGDKKTIDVSWAMLAKIGLALAVGYALYLAREVLSLALFALIISVLFNPAVDFLEKLKVPRGASVFLVYFSVFGIFGAGIYWLAPIFAIETQQLGQLFPLYFEKVSPFLSGMGFVIFQSMDAFVAAVRDWMVGASSGIIGSLGVLFGGILTTFTIIVAAAFFSLEAAGIKKFILLAIPAKREKIVLDWWGRAQVKISGWFAVRLAGMLAVGVFTSLACWALDIRYPVFLGFFAGVADIVPFIGPIASGAVIALVALLDSWQKAAAAIAIFTIIQQLENNLVIPLLSKKFIEFPAILVLLSLLAGKAIWGVAGAILAIPLFGVLYDFVRDYLMRNKRLNE